MNEAQRREEEHLASGLVRIVFELEQDDDGWPPAATERLWAEPVQSDTFRLDNTPFFYRGVSYNDIVSAEQRGNALFYREVVSHSGHSTLRIYVLEDDNLQAVLDDVVKLGGTYEGTSPYLKRYVAIDVAPQVELAKVQDYLRSKSSEGVLGFDEGLLAHPGAIPTPTDD